jgi:YHS domain-containing protein
MVMRSWRHIVFTVLLAWAGWASPAEPEGEGRCAMSAAQGTSLPTSCSVVWISPQDKLYCFSSEKAKRLFLQDPEANERRAQAFFKDPSLWEKLKKSEPEG